MRGLREGLNAPILVLILVLLSSTATAQTWNEVADAGDLIASAQSTIGTGPLTTINGTLSSASDVDIYCVRIGPTVDAVSIPVVGLQCVVNMGPNVWVFTSSGVGRSTTGTCQAGMKQLTTNTLATGSPQTMYVAVAYHGLAPAAGAGLLWDPSVTTERAPDGPDFAAPMVGWIGTPQVQPINPYTLTLSFAQFCDAPIPVESKAWGTIKALYRP